MGTPGSLTILIRNIKERFAFSLHFSSSWLSDFVDLIHDFVTRGHNPPQAAVKMYLFPVGRSDANIIDELAGAHFHHQDRLRFRRNLS